MKHKYLVISLFSVFGLLFLWAKGFIRCTQEIQGRAEGAWKRWVSFLGCAYLSFFSGFSIVSPLLRSVIARFFADASPSVRRVLGFVTLYFAGVVAASILAIWMKKYDE